MNPMRSTPTDGKNPLMLTQPHGSNPERRENRRGRTALRLGTALLAVGFATLAAAVLPGHQAGADSFAVTSCADGAPGSLRAEVALANLTSGANTIAFSVSCAPLQVSPLIEISNDLTITGPGANTLAIDGQTTNTIFQIDNGVTATISGLTLQQGNANGDGGAVINNGMLTIQNSDVLGSSASAFGGGIYNAGSLTIEGSSLSSDSAEGGGAIYNSSSGRLTVTDSTLSQNTALSGSGVTNLGAATVNGSTFSLNGGIGAGGGIYNGDNGRLTVNNSTFSGNTGASGGGIANFGVSGFPSAAIIVDSTFSGNTTFVTGDGGGLASATSDPLAIGATIVAGSGTSLDCADADTTDLGDNLDDDGSCGFTAGSDLSDQPAGLSSAGLTNNGGPTNTIALAPGSLAIKASSLCASPNPTVDQRGVARSTPTCDIGAFQSPTITLSPSPLPGATAETAYGQPLAGNGGTGPYTFTVTGTALPSWLQLSSGGILSGTPPTTASVPFTVQAKDSGGYTGSQLYTLSVSAPTIVVAPTPPLAAATWESPYSALFSATGGVGPYTYAESGTLPTGLTLTMTGAKAGTLSGTPSDKTQIGKSFPFTVTATDQGLFTGSQNYSITIASPCGPTAGITPYIVTATGHTGSFTGLFCVNSAGSGTYTQSGGAHGAATVGFSYGGVRITAFGSSLAFMGQSSNRSNAFLETAPAPVKAGTFTLL
jgi:hypothetical protein